METKKFIYHSQYLSYFAVFRLNTYAMGVTAFITLFLILSVRGPSLDFTIRRLCFYIPGWLDIKSHISFPINVI